MGPPSSGGLAVLQTLGILEKFDLSALGVQSAEAVHLIGEASALAFADRNAYVADADFVSVPINEMLTRKYLDRRAALIAPNRAGGERRHGGLTSDSTHKYTPTNDDKGLSTTHLSIIDSQGNAVSMTSSIETVFGSRLMTNGFILNNQLTDFSFYPSRDGSQVANSAAPGKRPRSSMSPTIVLDKHGKFIMAIGSPGGSRIIGFVIKNLIATLDWNMAMQAAIDLPNFLNRNGPIELEHFPEVEPLKLSLENKGHRVRIIKSASGLHGLRAIAGGLQGGADKRREGVVLSD